MKEHKFEIICVTTAAQSNSSTISRGKGLVASDSTGTSLPRVISGVPDNITLKEGDFILCYQPEKEIELTIGVEPFRYWYAQKLDKELVSGLLKNANLKFGVIMEDKVC